MQLFLSHAMRKPLHSWYKPSTLNLCIGFVLIILSIHMSHVMREPDFYLCENKGICENKGTDQLRTKCKADQRLCFCYLPLFSLQFLFFLNPKFQASSYLLLVQLGLCQTWSETPKTGFLASWLIYLFKWESIFYHC